MILYQAAHHSQPDQARQQQSDEMPVVYDRPGWDARYYRRGRGRIDRPRQREG